MKLTLKELKLHIHYNPDNGECIRIGYRNCHGQLVKCNYNIRGRTRPDRYGYYRVSLIGKRYLVHKLVYYYSTGEWPDTIDHIDGNCTNNELSNLRPTDRAGNMRNLKLRSDNPTGHIGVAIKEGKYYAHAQRGGERLFAGYFDTIDEAINARIEMSKELDFHDNHGSSR